MMKKISFLLLLVLCVYLLSAETLTLTIHYLGLPVVNVSMTDNGRSINVKAKATKIASIAAKMDNTYISDYTDNYLPLSYRKIIKQKGYWEDRNTHYDRSSFTAIRESFLSDSKNKKYQIKSESRDFFSALYFLRTVCENDSGELWLDANALIWKANYKLLGKEKISTKIGKIDALKMELTFVQISSGEKENTDMLTNNLVNEEKSLLFWFSDDERHIPLKAKFVMKPFSVLWKLESYDSD